MENVIHIYNIIFYSVQHEISVLLKIYSMGCLVHRSKGGYVCRVF